MIDNGRNSPIWIDLGEPALLLLILGKIDVFRFVFKPEFLKCEEAEDVKGGAQTSKAMLIFCPLGVAAVKSWIMMKFMSVDRAACYGKLVSCKTVIITLYDRSCIIPLRSRPEFRKHPHPALRALPRN